MDNDSLHVLLVEDEQDHAELIREAFEAGAERTTLRVARSVREAREALATATPDLVITDLCLPDGEGSDLLSDEKEEVLVPVVVMTGHGNEQAAVEAMKRGALDYVVKSEEILNGMPHVARRAMREWNHIAQRKTAERERERLIAELEAKNAELERFAYTVSHELKTPLITINGCLGLLEEDVADGNVERMTAGMSRITRATCTMHQLLKDLLELSRIGHHSISAAEWPMADLVDEALAASADKITERGIEVEVADELPLLFGDRTGLLEVLQNLIENAVKYLGDQPRPRITIGVRNCDAEVVCCVHDNGMGIAPCYHEKVFGLFDQLDPKSEGTGVGLAIVKRIIERHEGRIWIESEGQGRGLSCYFALPQHATTPGKRR